ncbi:DUF433 domain-containing protein [Endozoicomonas sp. SCSIO W0465]|nr:DUF433 domain-containing protein [Endozoicomonas sp. SCSIO W0465]USE37602.1 DUF433 domain-containing protein [Endozoicomonas sp. SCSIO W0465]
MHDERPDPFFLAEGMSNEEILGEHPNLKAIEIKAALLFAANSIDGAA